MTQIYVCTELDISGNCLTFTEYVNPFLPALSTEQGLQLGAAVLLCMATAWGIRFMLGFIINKR